MQTLALVTGYSLRRPRFKSSISNLKRGMCCKANGRGGMPGQQSQPIRGTRLPILQRRLIIVSKAATAIQTLTVPIDCSKNAAGSRLTVNIIADVSMILSRALISLAICFPRPRRTRTQPRRILFPYPRDNVCMARFGGFRLHMCGCISLRGHLIWCLSSESGRQAHQELHS